MITKTSTFAHKGRVVVSGTWLSFTGERGKFRFWQHCRNETTGAEWLDVFDSSGFPRYLKPDKIRVVHRKGTRR